MVMLLPTVTLCDSVEATQHVVRDVWPMAFQCRYSWIGIVSNATRSQVFFFSSREEALVVRKCHCSFSGTKPCPLLVHLHALVVSADSFPRYVYYHRSRRAVMQDEIYSLLVGFRLVWKNNCFWLPISLERRAGRWPSLKEKLRKQSWTAIPRIDMKPDPSNHPVAGRSTLSC